MLTNEAKRQIFFKLRSENYRASLRLEGLMSRPVSAVQPVVGPMPANLKKKHVR